MCLFSQLVAETAARSGSEAGPSKEAQQELSQAQEELSKAREELSRCKEEVQRKQEEVSRRSIFRKLLLTLENLT